MIWFLIATLGEFLRFQVSDNTVRVPNTRGFLSQNIFTDIIKPLTYSTDVVLNGGSTTNDSYEEYIRLDASAEKVSISKETKFENDVQLNQGQSIKWTNVFIREVQGPSRPEFDLIVNGSTSHLRLWVNGSIKQAITNTTIAFKVNIDAEQGLTVFTGRQLKTNTINSHTNSDLLIQRSGSTAITLKAGNEVDFSGYVNINNISTQNDTDMAIRRNDEEFIRLFKNETTSDEATICYKILRANVELKTNIINTLDNNSLDFQQNGNTFISLQSIANRIQVNRLLRVVDSGNSIQAQMVESNTGNYMSFTLGNHISAYTSGDSEADPPIPVNGNTLHLNYYSHGNVFLGTNQDTGTDPIPTITINKFSSDTGNAFEVQGNSVFSGTVSTNTLNSESGDLTIQRDGTDVLNIFTYSPTNGPSIIVDAQSDCGISSSWLFANTFANRTGNTDTEFRGAIAGGLSSGKVYMKYLHATERIDFYVNINSGFNITCLNLTETSDQRLKDNIKPITSKCSNIVKKLKVKKFTMKNDEKKRTNIGFVAQEVKNLIPKEFQNIVNEDNEHMSLNYGKISVLLWKSCQEMMEKMEKMEDEINQLKAKVNNVK